ALPRALPAAVEPRDGGDGDRDDPGDRALLPGPARLRRGRDPDGGEGMKLAVIGSGSPYTPELVSGLSRLEVSELALHDIDAERREVVGALAARMLDAQGYSGGLELTDALDRALDGADYVLIQIRVGGQEARLRDETVPLACGCIGQETTGGAGLAEGGPRAP